MGQAMTRHLIKHGYRVVAHDIARKALDAAAGLGAAACTTPAEVGKACRFVIVAVGYDHEAAAVMLDDDGLLQTMGKGSVIAISSTCTPEHVKMLAEKAQAKEIGVLDAPICRGQRAADEGTLLTLCGGRADVFERAKPIYASFSQDILLLGDIGAGQCGKAMNNFLLWVNGVALIEAGRLSEAYGMDLVKLREALLMSSGASDALKSWENVSFLWAQGHADRDQNGRPGRPVHAHCRRDQGARQGRSAHQADKPAGLDRARISLVLMSLGVLLYSAISDGL
jgi:3-hydroxyisobutyrate dehydrogenase-like beta-hydroxyacid dehydrogenase